MEQIINKIASETGVGTAQASHAYKVTLDSVKEVLPKSIADQLDKVIGGAEFDYVPVFKEKLDIMSNSANEKLHEATKETSDKLNELAEDAKKILGKLFA